MKRQLFATAMIGTFGLATGNAANADECSQVSSDASMACRPIAASDLGPHYCLQPERFGLRAMKTGVSSDPWVTGNSITLGGVAISVTGQALACHNKASAKLGGAELVIAKSGEKYQVTIAGKAIDMTIARDGNGNALWLAGADPNQSNLNYFVFFRDKSGNGGANSEKSGLPKFLYVQVLDFNESACKEIAPSLDKGTVKIGECGAPTHPEVRETGVGGGGEGGRNP